MVKIVGSGLKVMSVPVLLGFADDLQLLRGHAALERHVINLVVARNLDLEPIGKGVDALGADAVQAAGILVGALAEFAAGVQIGQHQFHRRHLPFRMHIHRDAAAIVADGDGAIDVDGDFDVLAIAGQMFVDGIVQHLEDAMVQAAFIGVADIHAGAFADGLQPLQFIDFGGIILLRRLRRRAPDSDCFSRPCLTLKIGARGRGFCLPRATGKVYGKRGLETTFK